MLLHRFRLIILLCLLGLALPATAETHYGAVTLRLNGAPSFEFAGYYTALAYGFYDDAGLEVSIIPGDDNPIDEVVAGRAQYGVGGAPLLLARQAGKPVVALAAIFQHSPRVLLTRADRSADRLEHLGGQRVSIDPRAESLLAMLQSKIGLKALQLLPQRASLEDLIEGRVDALSASLINEPYFLAAAETSYRLYSPRAAGIDSYGSALFTSQHELDTDPDRVAAFRAATLRGWDYAMHNPQEVALLLKQRFNVPYAIDFLLYQSERMQELVEPELIEIGYMNPDRWERMGDRYVRLGMLPSDFDLQGFLYQEPTPTDHTRLYIAVALMLMAYAVVLYTWHINRRLDLALKNSLVAEQAMRESEERHRLLADNATDVIWTMDLAGKITYISPSISRLVGKSPEKVTRNHISQLLTGACTEAISERLRQFEQTLLDDRGIEDQRLELEMVRCNGSTVWADATLSEMRNKQGAFIGLLGVARDISERRRAEARIAHMARHDPLTDLPNRALFSDRLRQALVHSKRYQHSLAVLFIDLDRFKPINDTYGHDIGDQLLKQAASRMLACIRESDTLARIGGDEFVVLLTRITDHDAVAQVAEKLQLTLRAPFALADQQLHVSCSIGVALYPDDGIDETALCKHADEAMYRAKKGGRDAVRFYKKKAVL